MRISYIISVFVIFLSAVGRLYGQAGAANQLFYHISEKDGLADNVVNCFFQDSRGIMWMGTQYGLNSFDGSEIKTWRPGAALSKNQGLTNEIRDITEDKHHVLWIGTSGGIMSFDLLTKKTGLWQYKGDNYMRKLACSGDSLWIATGDGLLLFDTSRKTFLHFSNTEADKTSLTYYFDNSCNSLLLDSKKRLWIATVNGLWQFDMARHTFEQYDGPKNDTFYDGMVNTIFEDHTGKIWTGCWSKGLKQIVPENHGVKNYNIVPGMPYHIMSVVEQRNSNNEYTLWLSGFLSAFKTEGLKVERHDLKPIAEVASLEPRCLYISRDNLLWISTVKGVYILDPSRQLFKQYFIVHDAIISDQNPAMFAQNGRLWIGGDKDFVLKQFDDKFNMVKDFTPNVQLLKAEYADKGLAVMNITPDNKGDLWLSTTAGILKLNPKNGNINIVCRNVTDSLKRNIGFINNVFINDGNTWCFPWRRGVWQLDHKSGRFEPLVVKLPEGDNRPKNLNLQSAVKDNLGNVWITDLDYGIVKYTTATKKFERIVNGDITPYTRAINVRNIKGLIWLIANTSIVTIDPATNKTKSWPLPGGMNKYVYDYTDDENGNIWIATRTGLVVFNTVNHSFNQYTEEDGLITNDMNGALQKLPSGGMVYAGENYMTSFKPADLLRTPAKKSMLLTEISTGDTDLTKANPKKITIPAGSEKVTFRWALINYANPLQNRYYNKLDKIDNDWNYAGNKGMVVYNGLPPGDYKFRYRAVTADGLTGDEKTLLFTVEPTIWQSGWFRSSITILLLIGVLLIIRYVRIREQKKSALQLQLSALEMKALRAQMNPHFIFNALNSIQECIVTKNTDTAYSYLSSFSKLVRMILENSEKQFITLEDEVETLRLYLSVEKLRFDDTFEYKINISPKIDTSFVHLPAMIIQPFAENALWHGLIHKKGEKKLTISFEQEKNDLICTIKDNGIGRDLSQEMQANSQVKKHSMGMKITEERLQLLETEARITIDDLKDSAGNALGTIVTIIIPIEF